jgi:predicted DNA-binding protein (MmcQ/YjbR family)
MDAERMRGFLRSFPNVVDNMQWGESLVFWVGDKAIGGKMFAVVNLNSERQVISYAAGPEHFAEMVEVEGVVPAPYLARAFWVSVARWDVLRTTEWEQELRAAYALIFDKLPARTKAVLAMPAAQQKRVIAERKKLLAARAAAKAG